MTGQADEALDPSEEEPSEEDPSEEDPSEEDPSEEEPSEADPSARGRIDFNVVGIGASAGGLAALQTFFGSLPADCGVSFVVVTHQHAGHTSLLSDLLARHSPLPVQFAEPGIPLEPGVVFVAPPGGALELREGRFEFVADAHQSPPLPIDQFFESLARELGPSAVGIILSGAGQDGSRGLTAIKGVGGLVLVQAEASATHAGMPNSAIATGLVDYVAPVEELSSYLLDSLNKVGSESRGLSESGPGLSAVISLLHERSGHDFSHYKRSTMVRRVARRMNACDQPDLNEYLRHLERDTAEADALFHDLLIGVTAFFRDPTSFAALSQALAELLAAKSKDYPFRAWVAGCSTGEEAFSVAILLREINEQLGKRIPIQIFATDLDGRAVDRARAGVFAQGCAAAIGPERLERFFQREGESYRVSKEIRECVVFATQNLIADPPFTQLDLLVCRNLLIYLESPIQRRLLPLFHYALRPGGLLFLGSAESVGASSHLFEVVDRKAKLFRRLEVPEGTYVAELPSGSHHHRRSLGGALPTPALPTKNLSHLCDQLLLHELVPPSVLVRENGEVVHIHGRTGAYLEPPPGAQVKPSLFAMLREGVYVHLRAALRDTSEGGLAWRRGLTIQEDGAFDRFDLRVQKLTLPPALRGLYLVSFCPAQEQADPDERVSLEEPTGSLRFLELEHQLQHVRESHQGAVEELEATNEELQSANEELQSANEELQSANEELETSKEEMQSLNEELQTVNSELQLKVEQLSQANDDMRNLLNGTKIAMVFVDEDLRILRFTDQATEVIRLIPSDVGRPIGDLVTRFRYDRLAEDAAEVLRTLEELEFEVQGERPGTHYLLRIHPYRTTENLIRGLVITCVDVTTTVERREGSSGPPAGRDS